MGRKELFKLQVTSLDGIPDLDLHTHSLRSHDVILISPHPLRSLADTLAPPVLFVLFPLTYVLCEKFVRLFTSSPRGCQFRLGVLIDLFFLCRFVRIR
jgi:hypothetical protein